MFVFADVELVIDTAPGYTTTTTTATIASCVANAAELNHLRLKLCDRMPTLSQNRIAHSNVFIMSNAEQEQYIVAVAAAPTNQHDVRGVPRRRRRRRRLAAF